MQLEVLGIFPGHRLTAVLTPFHLIYLRNNKISEDIQEGETITFKGNHIETRGGKKIDIFKPY